MWYLVFFMKTKIDCFSVSFAVVLFLSQYNNGILWSFRKIVDEITWGHPNCVGLRGPVFFSEERGPLSSTIGSKVKYG